MTDKSKRLASTITAAHKKDHVKGKGFQSSRPKDIRPNPDKRVNRFWGNG